MALPLGAKQSSLVGLRIFDEAPVYEFRRVSSHDGRRNVRLIQRVKRKANASIGMHLADEKSVNIRAGRARVPAFPRRLIPDCAGRAKQTSGQHAAVREKVIGIENAVYVIVR